MVSIGLTFFLNLKRVMIRLLRFLTIGLMLFFAASGNALAAGRRVALVIGNSAYAHVPQLTNPANDATDIAAELKKLGFEVIAGTDADKRSMKNALRQFVERRRGAEASLFFYAGHGIQMNGQNYLIPTDAELKDTFDVDWDLISLSKILEPMANEAGGTSIILLDACRNNPFENNFRSGSRAAFIVPGLARVETASGTFISFSTAPNNVAEDGTGRNSPFAEALLRHISTPGEDLASILTDVKQDVNKATKNKQTPWSEDSLTSKFYFIVPETADPREHQFWQSVGTSSNPEELKAYISQYPNGHFVPVAKLRIAELENRRDAAMKQQLEEMRKEMEAARHKDVETEAEIGYWNSVNKNDPEVLELYLQNYPQGIYSLLAHKLIDQDQAGAGEAEGYTRRKKGAAATKPPRKTNFKNLRRNGPHAKQRMLKPKGMRRRPETLTNCESFRMISAPETWN